MGIILGKTDPFIDPAVIFHSLLHVMIIQNGEAR